MAPRALMIAVLSALLLTSCGMYRPAYVINPVANDRSVAIFVLKNPKRTPDEIGYEPVTPDNRFDYEKYTDIIGATGKFFSSGDRLHSQCFKKSQVCFMAGLAPGRYHMSHFAFVKGNSREEMRLAADGGLKDWFKVNPVFDKSDWYFNAPANSAFFLGSYEWGYAKQGLTSWLKNGIQFEFGPSKSGSNERAALQQLMDEPEFSKNFPAWAVLVQKRLDRLAVTPRAPAKAVAPKAPPPTGALRKK